MMQSSESRGRTTLLFSTPRPPLPADLFELGNRTYLLVVDYYSRFVEIAKLSGTTVMEVISHTKSIFARYPTMGHSTHQLCMPSSQRSMGLATSPGNGEAERAVRTVKSLLKKQGDPYLALLAHRATPLQCGYSPSELLMARKLRTIRRSVLPQEFLTVTG